MKLGTEYSLVRHWMTVGFGVAGLVGSCIIRNGGVAVFFLVFLVLLTIAARQQKTYTIVLENGSLVLTGAMLVKRNVVTYHVEDIWLELIYSGSTGEAKDAMLNVFKGKKCVRQVHVKEGYTEAQFRELIVAFDAMKAAIVV